MCDVMFAQEDHQGGDDDDNIQEGSLEQERRAVYQSLEKVEIQKIQDASLEDNVIQQVSQIEELNDEDLLVLINMAEEMLRQVNMSKLQEDDSQENMNVDQEDHNLQEVSQMEDTKNEELLYGMQ